MATQERIGLIAAAGLVFLMTGVPAVAAPTIEEPLRRGQLQIAEQLLGDHLQGQPEDDLARFQLGVVKLLRGVETLTQAGVRYGATTGSIRLPFIRLGGIGGSIAAPAPVTYEDLRTMIKEFQASVGAAEATLAKIDANDLYWPLDFRRVAIDFDGDGLLKERERLDVLFRFAGGARGDIAGNPSLTVGLDAADVSWLRGYCHVLQALADMVLAYDHQRMFDLTAHAFFIDPRTKFARARDPKNRQSQQRSDPFWGGMEWVADAIAAIHLIDFPLREPQRMRDARGHLLKMVELSHKHWELVLQESDNRQELIPGPTQTSVIPGMIVNAERIEAWKRFLQEARAILDGDKLLPFWRSGFAQGVNLRRVFTDPRDFDLILWMQGTAALPYLEEGEQTDPQLWREFQRLFRGRFLGFALWVN